MLILKVNGDHYFVRCGCEDVLRGDPYRASSLYFAAKGRGAFVSSTYFMSIQRLFSGLVTLHDADNDGSHVSHYLKQACNGVFVRYVMGGRHVLGSRQGRVRWLLHYGVLRVRVTSGSFSLLRVPGPKGRVNSNEFAASQQASGDNGFALENHRARVIRHFNADDLLLIFVKGQSVAGLCVVHHKGFQADEFQSQLVFGGAVSAQCAFVSFPHATTRVRRLVSK